jgi:hypothetical protein
VISVYLQQTVAEMSNKEREAGGVATDFSKFSEEQLKKVVKALGKSQGTFLLKQDLIKHRKVGNAIDKKLLSTINKILIDKLSIRSFCY